MSELRAPDGPTAGAVNPHQNPAADYRAVRARSLALTEVLEIEDYGVQPMADASPPKWHLAHTTWFFETFLLRPFLPGYRPFHPRFEYLFNSYYNAVGEQFPRPRRGDLSRPTVAEVLAYRRSVDDAMQTLLAALPDGADAEDILARTVLGMHHEEQHQELLVTDLKYAFGHNPLHPVHAAARPVVTGEPVPLTFSRFEAGLVTIGTGAPAAGGDREAFVFDNETPAHAVHLLPFELADRCVTCGEYLAFMADGGYSRPELWLADGWSWLHEPDAPRAPLYWFRDDAGRWFEYTLAGARPLDPHAPVTHLSFLEADAYARWAELADPGLRLPLEAEWEHAARVAAGAPRTTFLDHMYLHPEPDPGASAGTGPRGLFGGVWEWTASAYSPYPGYRPLPGALGEYNGKFMCNQLVLRGGSCATPAAHVRPTYRNFFHAPDRWQFTGVRLARDL